MKVKYISWNYGRGRVGCFDEPLHLVRYENGFGKLFTDAEMVSMGLAKWRQ